eukprot:GHVN01059436.1.p4 GENE.GHVN01059436.1~~GHVN01059436.1.p4  ORF type:complete len:131 (-),score=0.67 GHVN01059436.1:96-488(-)
MGCYEEIISHKTAKQEKLSNLKVNNKRKKLHLENVFNKISNFIATETLAKKSEIRNEKPNITQLKKRNRIKVILNLILSNKKLNRSLFIVKYIKKLFNKKLLKYYFNLNERIIYTVKKKFNGCRPCRRKR